MKAISNEETKADSSVDCSSMCRACASGQSEGNPTSVGQRTQATPEKEWGNLSCWAAAVKRSGGSELQRHDDEV